MPGVTAEKSDQANYIERDELLQHLKDGKPLESDQKEGRPVKAKLLRSLLIGQAEEGEEKADPDPRGLKLANAKVEGELDLRYCEISFPIEFNDCSFEEPFLLHSATLGELSLRKCRLRPKAMEGSTPDISAHTAIDASGSTINGCLVIQSCSIDALVKLTGANIKGNLEMSGSSLGRVPEDIKERCEEAYLLNAERIKIEGDALLDEGFSSLGLNFRDGKIGGHLCMNGAEVQAINEIAINMDGAKIDGGIEISSSEITVEENGKKEPVGKNPFSCQGLFRIVDARVAGNFEMKGAKLEAPKEISKKTLEAPDKTVGREDGETSYTECALRADLVEIDGCIKIQDITANGCISFAQARCGEQFFIIGGSLKGNQNALNAPDVKINSFAKLGGSLPYEKTHSKQGEAEKTKSILKVEGSIDMRGARVQGSLDLSEVEFVFAESEPEGRSEDSNRSQGSTQRTRKRRTFLDLSRLSVNELILPPGRPGLEKHGGADLVSASIDSLGITNLGTKDKPSLFPLNDATGWRVGNIRDLHEDQNRILREWLADQPSAQPLRALADVAERYLNNRLAREWRFRAEVLERKIKASPLKLKKKEVRERKSGRKRISLRKLFRERKNLTRTVFQQGIQAPLIDLFHRIKSILYRVTSGYGYYPEFIPMWILLLYAVSFGMSRYFEPDIESHMQGRAGAQSGAAPEFNPFAHALVVTVPAAGLFRMQTEAPPELEFWFSLLRVFGWIFSTLFLASITGLLRRGK